MIERILLYFTVSLLMVWNISMKSVVVISPNPSLCSFMEFCNSIIKCVVFCMKSWADDASKRILLIVSIARLKCKTESESAFIKFCCAKASCALALT